MNAVADAALNKDLRVYYFDREGHTHDISQLDPGSNNAIESGWGGIAEFSGRVADVVSQAIASERNLE
jgi:hypothetical protein